MINELNFLQINLDLDCKNTKIVDDKIKEFDGIKPMLHDTCDLRNSKYPSYKRS